MNIGLFSGSFSSPDSGGAYTIENEILNAISQYAIETPHKFSLYSKSIYSLKNISSVHPTFKNRVNGLKIKIQKFFTDGLFLHQSDSFCEMIKQDNPDIIFFLTPWSYFEVGIPYISIVWDLQHRLQPQFPEVSAKGEFERREKNYSKILPRARFIITGSETGKNEIEKFYNIPPERIKILPHPTPEWALQTSEYRNRNIKEKYNIKKEYLFYPAQFWSHKNHLNLVHALKILNHEYKCDFELVLAGSDKGEKKSLQEYVDINNLSHFVHFLGFVDQSDIIALYKNAFVLTYVSLFGPENLPPLEAFAIGCPVIASNVSGAEEQLKNAAILVNAAVPREIANAVIRLQKDRELRNELIKAGKVRANKWTAKDFVLGLFKVFDEFDSITNCRSF